MWHKNGNQCNFVIWKASYMTRIWSENGNKCSFLIWHLILTNKAILMINQKVYNAASVTFVKIFSEMQVWVGSHF